MRFEPLAITARLGAPLAGDAALPLDGLLLALALENAWGRVVGHTPNEAPDYPPDIVPLARGGSGDDWYYRASYAQWDDNVVSAIDHWSRRFSLHERDTLASQTIEIGSGRRKPRFEARPVRFTRALRWYAVGDGEAIERLLSTCGAIGKKRSVGYGTVLRWEVAPADADHSVVSAGRLMRNVPHAALDVRTLAHLPATALRAIRPPYWARAHVRLCYVPGEALYD